MKLVRTYIMATFFPLVFITKTDNKLFEHTLHGVVANKETGKPLPDIYIYTIKGEEEAITNSRGQFKFVTWQMLPVTLYVHHGENENIRIVVSNASEEIKIKL